MAPAVLERALVRVSIGCAQRRSQEWRFFSPCYNQLMLRPWTRRLQRTTDGPWIPLHRRSACGIILTSIHTLCKSTFDCVTMQARAFPPNVGPHDVSTSPRLFIFRGQDALCLRDRTFAPYTDDRSHQEVKEMRWPFFPLMVFMSFSANWCVIMGFRGLFADLVVQRCREHGSVNWAWI